MNGNPIDPESTYTVKNEADEDVTLTLADILAMMQAKSVEIGELLYTAVGNATKPDKRLEATAALLAHINDCPAEGTAGFAELVAKANAKNVEVVTEQYDLIAAMTDLDEKQEAIVTISLHLASYPADSAELVANIKALACTIAEELYAEWELIPTVHVDAEGDGACDFCTGANDSATSTHYFARYNGIYAAKYYIASIGLLTKGNVASGLTAAESAIATKIVDGSKAMDAEMIAKQYALDSQAAFDEYDLGKPILAYDCENNLMTSYNKINGVWGHYHFELVQTVLREEWGYKGNVMTDWWMRYAPSPEFPKLTGNAYRVRARVDVLMPGNRSIFDKSRKPDGTLLKTYGQEDGITLGELQETAKNVLRCVMELKEL